ncbi:MAG: hypothetical protein U0289_06150 [Cyclobacteriaceae bacterium]|nr:hypothetical protein [Cytophagales bacterium]HNP77528.1 hypothetical protein [Cyclobacteriaceae bacterium]
MITRLIVLMSILLMACQAKVTRETPKEATSIPFVIDKAAHIKRLINSVGFVSLPFNYDVYKSNPETRFSIDRKTVDLLGFDYGPIQGVLPDTSSHYVFLHYVIGDSVYPILNSFDKNGNKIDQQGIGVCYCNGGGPIARQDECTDVVTIHRDLTIEAFYRFRGILQPDSQPGKYVCEQRTIAGRITGDGRIELKKSEMQDCSKK